MSENQQRNQLSSLTALFNDKQRIAYSGLVVLILQTQQSQRLKLHPGLRQSYAALSDTLTALLFSLLEVSEEEAAMLRQLASPESALVPADLAVSLINDNSVVLHQNLCEAVVSHLFVLIVSSSGAVYDSRARALLFHVGAMLHLSTGRVAQLEQQVLSAVGFTGDGNSVFADSIMRGDFGGSTSVDRRNKMESVKRMALVTLATIAGGVLIGATAGLAGPVVAGAFTSAHLAHCGGTVAVGLGSTGVALFATGGAAAAGGMSGYRVLKKARGISEFSFIPFLSGHTKGISVGKNKNGASETLSADHDLELPSYEVKKCSDLDENPPQIRFATEDEMQTSYGPDSFSTKMISVLVTVPGFIHNATAKSVEQDVMDPFTCIHPTTYGERFSLMVDPPISQRLCASMTLVNYYTEAIVRKLPGNWSLDLLVQNTTGPLWTHRLRYLVDKLWPQALENSKNAGILLADAIEMRVQGARPVSLIGFGLGARTILYACIELAKRAAAMTGSGDAGMYGSLIENVILCGLPAVVPHSDWNEIGALASGRVVNAFLSKDRVLGYAFRKSVESLANVAGIAPTTCPSWVESICLDSIIDDHVDYLNKSYAVLQAVGIEFEENADIKASAVYAKASYQSDLQDAQERFAEEWNVDVDLTPKQEEFDRSFTAGIGGERRGSGGILGWFQRRSSSTSGSVAF